MKYILMPVQPFLNAFSQAPSRSSSVTSLLITSRMRWLPASGASVRLCRFPCATASATRTEKVSTRVLGSEILRPRSPNSALSVSTISAICVWSVVLSDISESSL